MATVVAVHAASAQPTRPQSPPRDTSDAPSLPREVARDVVDLYNAPTTTRADGKFDVGAGETIRGDVAVLGGPVNVAGHITGRLVVINADLTLAPGARVDGDVTVIGGVVDGRGQATLGGELHIHRQVLYFHREGERLVADTPSDAGAYRFWRWLHRDENRAYAGLTLSSQHTYNRVEGLPILIGPTVVRPIGRAQVRADAFLLYRTSGHFRWDSASIGHLVRGEVRLGRTRGVRVGGRLYDEIAPVERWQLGDAEVGLATFFLHRDFRDYYNRHGGTLFASLFAGDGTTFTLSLADERWASVRDRDPFTLIRNAAAWRENPRLDDGLVHVANAALHMDSRNDEYNPWAGWYVDADLERGAGTFTSFGALSADAALVGPVSLRGVPSPLPGARDTRPGRREYTRGFLDVRRYNRLSPEAQLNLRAVVGGRLGGDALPLERRLSVTGPGALAGYDFRRPTAFDADLGQCSFLDSAPTGSPAQCDRVALGQAEFRGTVHVGFPFFDVEQWTHVAVHTAASWVLFADAGRGWLVGEPQGKLVYRSNELPPFSSFLSDLGAGLDFGSGGTADVASFGVYVAKAVSGPHRPANVFVRVRRRF